MTEEKFIQKYGNRVCEFHSIYKMKIRYVHKNRLFFIVGKADYRTALEKEETVTSLFIELDDFEFKMIKEVK